MDPKKAGFNLLIIALRIAVLEFVHMRAALGTRLEAQRPGASPVMLKTSTESKLGVGRSYKN